METNAKILQTQTKGLMKATVAKMNGLSLDQVLNRMSQRMALAHDAQSTIVGYCKRGHHPTMHERLQLFMLNCYLLYFITFLTN